MLDESQMDQISQVNSVMNPQPEISGDIETSLFDQSSTANADELQNQTLTLMPCRQLIAEPLKRRNKPTLQVLSTTDNSLNTSYGASVDRYMDVSSTDSYHTVFSLL